MIFVDFNWLIEVDELR